MTETIIKSAVLETTAVRPEQYPTAGLPEIAIIGKSNVGKSSFINTMAGRKGLARTSGAPGKTRVINFYNIDGRLRFVDLPGYGYAKVSRDESAKWQKMIEGYLRGRKTLVLVIFLLDIRHEPSANDKMMADWFLHYGHNIQYVATKSDKITRSALQKNLSIIRKSIAPEGLGRGREILPFSSLTRAGREELWEVLQNMEALNPGAE
ncbi:MAG: ribosome biogenesis GTP-binding protein YihA/YsxC [Defluviitaleaceae bacterium]|nr:ribosome biogenesis GTP-binding protein YihA/YsxC [Defluviitaleaceae bacterium]